MTWDESVNGVLIESAASECSHSRTVKSSRDEKKVKAFTAFGVLRFFMVPSCLIYALKEEGDCPVSFCYISPLGRPPLDGKPI